MGFQSLGVPATPLAGPLMAQERKNLAYQPNSIGTCTPKIIQIRELRVYTLDDLSWNALDERSYYIEVKHSVKQTSQIKYHRHHNVMPNVKYQ
jgi:hypothetical protein